MEHKKQKIYCPCGDAHCYSLGSECSPDCPACMNQRSLQDYADGKMPTEALAEALGVNFYTLKEAMEQYVETHEEYRAVQQLKQNKT